MTSNISKAAQAMGKKGGLSKSAAKSAASRENGKKGGRAAGDEPPASHHFILEIGKKELNELESHFGSILNLLEGRYWVGRKSKSFAIYFKNRADKECSRANLLNYYATKGNGGKEPAIR